MVGEGAYKEEKRSYMTYMEKMKYKKDEANRAAAQGFQAFLFGPNNADLLSANRMTSKFLESVFLTRRGFGLVGL